VFAHDVIKSIRQPEGVTTNFTYDFRPAGARWSDPRAPASRSADRLHAENSAPPSRSRSRLARTTMEWCTDAPHPRAPTDSNPGRDVLMVKRSTRRANRALEYGDGGGNLTKATVVFGSGKARSR